MLLEAIIASSVRRALATYATFDPLRKGDNITLSDGNLTETPTALGMSVAATDPVEASTALRYWEVLIIGGDNYSGHGLAPASSTDFNHSPGTVVGAVALYNDGTLTVNGSDVSSGHMTFTAGDRIKLLLHNGSLWTGIVGGAWDGDPVAGTGALYTGMTGLMSPVAGTALDNITGAATYNFGATAFVDTPPLGATGWVHALMAMELTGTLVGGVVGVSYSGTLTLSGDFVAPVTIDASSGSLPSWATPTVTGNTVSFPGTPTTATTYTFTPRATDANGQEATGPAQSVVIEAAATGLAIGVTATASSTGTSVTTTGVTTQATGSGIVATVVTQFYGAGDGLAVTDNKGNTYTLIDSARESSGNVYASKFYCAHATGGSGHTFSAAAGTHTSMPTIFVAEITSGTGIVLDQTVATNGSTSPFSSGSVTTTAANELIIAVAGVQKSSGNVTFTTSDGSTILQSHVSATRGAMTWKSAPTIGSYTMAFGITATPMTVRVSMSTFKKA